MQWRYLAGSRALTRDAKEEHWVTAVVQKHRHLEASLTVEHLTKAAVSNVHWVAVVTVILMVIVTVILMVIVVVQRFSKTVVVE